MPYESLFWCDVVTRLFWHSSATYHKLYDWPWWILHPTVQSTDVHVLSSQNTTALIFKLDVLLWGIGWGVVFSVCVPAVRWWEEISFFSLWWMKHKTQSGRHQLPMNREDLMEHIQLQPQLQHQNPSPEGLCSSFLPSFLLSFLLPFPFLFLYFCPSFLPSCLPCFLPTYFHFLHYNVLLYISAYYRLQTEVSNDGIKGGKKGNIEGTEGRADETDLEGNKCGKKEGNNYRSCGKFFHFNFFHHSVLLSISAYVFPSSLPSLSPCSLRRKK